MQVKRFKFKFELLLLEESVMTMTMRFEKNTFEIVRTFTAASGHKIFKCETATLQVHHGTEATVHPDHPKLVPT